MDVDSVDAMKGRLGDVNVEIHFIKELDYTMMLMSSYGTLEKVGNKKKRIWIEENSTVTKETTIKCPGLVLNLFSFVMLLLLTIQVGCSHVTHRKMEHSEISM